MALGSGAVQVCTAAMLHGFRIVEEMKDGLSRWMDSRATQPGRLPGRRWAYHRLEVPGHQLQVIAHIDQDACIGCGRCHIACEDTSHQAIASTLKADGTHAYR
jgi:dihydropyrimidine dehydrogenase (NAD+) subunit PreA